ncbi:lytic transglycosylase domain-containing protein [Candidimonas humi]|uniref:Lytic transglycosylase domain-containing protein n=1 Tax=Candidimonas humi TaxID=683355 RepID=A0ABV8NV43_9BURK
MHDALVATLRPDVMQGGSSVTSYASYAQASDAMLAAAMGPVASVSAGGPEPAEASSESTANGAGSAGSRTTAGGAKGTQVANAAHGANATGGANAALAPVVAGAAAGAPERKAGAPVPAKGGSKVELVSPGYFSRALGVAAEDLSIPHVSKAQAEALRSYIARKYQIAYNAAGVLIKTAFVVGKEQHLDPQLLLAVIAVESRYNPFAESHVGAQGLMQVMTNVHKDKFARFGGGLAAALNPIANIRVGSQILKDCIKRRGSVLGGLACYVGASGSNDGGYGAKVLAEQRRIALASGIPIEK